MMARPLPQWCKNVKIELVRRDMSISDLAKLVGLTKQYTSGIVCQEHQRCLEHP